MQIGSYKKKSQVIAIMPQVVEHSMIADYAAALVKSGILFLMPANYDWISYRTKEQLQYKEGITEV
jgi:hypothetical protein